MGESRHALIVANDSYQDPGLKKLRAPAQDAVALAEVLGDPHIGDFDVQVMRNEPAHVISMRIDDFFSDRRPGDTLVLHFSCHGLKSEAGELYFAAHNTLPRRLASTAVAADFVRRCMATTRARSIVLLLDCCYGGAFSQGPASVRAAGDVHVLDSFVGDKLGGGRGWAVITASNSMEYAFEGTSLAEGSAPRPSVFTHAVVKGLATGEADLDEDGRISLDELYEYVFDHVRRQNPNQTPSRTVDMQGDMYLARSHRRRIVPSPVPDDVRAAMGSPDIYTRRGAIAELRARMENPDLSIAVGAREALAVMAARDIRAVAEEASRALSEVGINPHPVRLDFEPVPHHAPSPHRTVCLLGPPLARSCAPHVKGERLRARESEAGLDVWVDTSSPGPASGDIVLKGVVGEAVLHVEAEVLPAGAGPAAEPGSGAPAGPGADAGSGAGTGAEPGSGSAGGSGEEPVSPAAMAPAAPGSAAGAPGVSSSASPAGTPAAPSPASSAGAPAASPASPRTPAGESSGPPTGAAEPAASSPGRPDTSSPGTSPPTSPAASGGRADASSGGPGTPSPDRPGGEPVASSPPSASPSPSPAADAGVPPVSPTAAGGRADTSAGGPDASSPGRGAGGTPVASPSPRASASGSRAAREGASSDTTAVPAGPPGAPPPRTRVSPTASRSSRQGTATSPAASPPPHGRRPSSPAGGTGSSTASGPDAAPAGEAPAPPRGSPSPTPEVPPPSPRRTPTPPESTRPLPPVTSGPPSRKPPPPPPRAPRRPDEVPPRPAGTPPPAPRTPATGSSGAGHRAGAATSVRAPSLAAAGLVLALLAGGMIVVVGMKVEDVVRGKIGNNDITLGKYAEAGGVLTPLVLCLLAAAAALALVGLARHDLGARPDRYPAGPTATTRLMAGPAKWLAVPVLVLAVLVLVALLVGGRY
ncbi:caspase family protein [Streptomyces sp. NPDC005931]|uniref:caspase, EACC1-associated type n=1 Tax=Streptomyces sp. NPDC005931 TaxID=3364737 RepID=UPI0036ABBB81